MRDNKQIKVKVTGDGRFPFDMLRHDCAWPNTANDAALIESTKERTIVISIAKRRFFTPARWRSFGWTAVVSDECVLECATFPLWSETQAVNWSR